MIYGQLAELAGARPEQPGALPDQHARGPRRTGHVADAPGIGAHTDYEAAARFLEEVLERQLAELDGEPVKSLLASRYEKFRKMGQFFDLQA